MGQMATMSAKGYRNGDIFFTECASPLEGDRFLPDPKVAVRAQPQSHLPERQQPGFHDVEGFQHSTCQCSQLMLPPLR